MSLAGPRFTPPGPKIPSDTYTSKNKTVDSFAVSTMAVPLYTSVTTPIADQITAPVTGMLVMDTNIGKLMFYTGTDWETVTST